MMDLKNYVKAKVAKKIRKVFVQKLEFCFSGYELPTQRDSADVCW